MGLPSFALRFFFFSPNLIFLCLSPQFKQEEVEELVKYCPISRQTMLFSATMTSRVEDLIKLSLKRPVRVRITGMLMLFFLVHVLLAVSVYERICVLC